MDKRTTSDKITIVEGPPPTFEPASDGWAYGLYESPTLGDIAVTRLRTYNGPALVERCHRAWRHQHPIYLEYRGSDGMEQGAPIVAARFLEVDEGHLLFLWVRLANEEAELEFGYGDEADDDDDIDFQGL